MRRPLHCGTGQKTGSAFFVCMSELNLNLKHLLEEPATKKCLKRSGRKTLIKMKKYWLHRITGGDNAFEYAYPLLFTHNYLSIGWSDFSEDAFVKDVQKRGATAIDEAFQKEEWGLPRNRWNLWRFVKEMKKGDIVVIPTSGEFSLFEIEDDVVLSNESIDPSIYMDWNGNKANRNDKGYYCNAQGNIIDLGFYRKARPILCNIPRQEYADQQLISRMKIRQTNADITDLQNSVEEARKNRKEQKPINLKGKIVEDIAPILLDLIKKYTDANRFEHLVEWYLKSIGAKTYVPSKNESKTEDGDADVVGYFENIKTVIMVQVKKHEGTTDDWAVQQIKAFRTNHQYDDYHTQMWVISSGEQFSLQAQNEAEAAGIRLISGKEFAEMILDTGLEKL